MLRRNTLIVAGVSFFYSGYPVSELLLEASGKYNIRDLASIYSKWS